MENQFERWHPVSQLAYYVFVFGISVFIMHPVITGISFISAIFLGIVIDRKRFLKMFICLYIPAVIAGIIINPLFSHEGVSIIWYFPDGNPLTAESIIYGIMAGIMIGSIFTFLFSFNKVMTSDKVMYLTGCVLPYIALVISMVLRFIPEFKHHLSEVLVARKCIGKGLNEKNLMKKIRNACTVMSVMATWAFESSVDKSDSMRARGYGICRRSSYSIFRYTKKDIVIIAVILAACGYMIYAIMSGAVYVQYYPCFKMEQSKIAAGFAYFLYAAVCILPVFDIWMEERVWKSLQSKI